MSARDVLAFARMHLEDGVASDGTRILAPGTAARMRDHQIDVPETGALGVAWGLGQERFGVGEHPVEIEDDGRDHGCAIFSPARTATFRRFSRGGTGHS